VRVLPLSIGAGLGLTALLAAPLARELRLKRPAQPLDDGWQAIPVEPRDSTPLGINFRSPQLDSLGLGGAQVLESLLPYPFELIRLGAYWNRIETAPGTFDSSELESQLDAVERAGKQIILCVGAIKTFGYPEYFVPGHRLAAALPERTRIRPAAYPDLLASAVEFSQRIVERYATRSSIVAWQIEHEAVDPLGLEHSWRLDQTFVEREVDAVRRADPSRPILLNGYLPVSLPVLAMQWLQTHDQGDSLAFAQQHADIVGLDYYPRHALVGLGPLTLYLDAVGGGWQDARRKAIFAWARTSGRRLMISEGQAEPWEAVTRPPDPYRKASYSCPPEKVIDNYNACIRWAREARLTLQGYLFWGAEYWVLRARSGDRSYLGAFEQILTRS
jgi:hypothetical protein